MKTNEIKKVLEKIIMHFDHLPCKNTCQHYKEIGTCEGCGCKNDLDYAKKLLKTINLENKKFKVIFTLINGNKKEFIFNEKFYNITSKMVVDKCCINIKCDENCPFYDSSDVKHLCKRDFDWHLVKGFIISLVNGLE